MERLTTNKPVSEMSTVELAHNSCYAENREAMYRDYEKEYSARDLAREMAVKMGIWNSPVTHGQDADNEMIDNDIFDDTMCDYLQYGIDTNEGRVALFYRNLWAQADLYETLKKYEDTGLTPQEIMDGKMLTGWISVEERLPQTDKDGYAYVMVCMNDEFIATTEYIKDEGFSLWEDSGEVLAWMPLPESYKPEEGK